MKAFIAVLGEDSGKIGRYLDYDTLAEAEAHVVRAGVGFAVADPGGSTAFWVVDMGAETLTYNPADKEAKFLLRLRASKDTEVGAELARRSVLIHGTPMTVDRLHRVNTQFGYRKAKGTISAGDETKADALDDLGDKADTLYDTIEAAPNTATVDAIDVTDDAHWA